MLDGDDTVVGQGGYPGEATGEDLVGGFGLVLLDGSGESAQHEAQGLDFSLDEGGGCGQLDGFLGDPGMGSAANSLDEVADLFLGECFTEDGLESGAGESGFENEFVEVFFDEAQDFGFPAPPGSDGGDEKFLLEEVAAESRKKSHKSGCFDDTTAEGVGDGDLSVDGGQGQARHSESAVGSEFKGIGCAVIEASQEHIDGLESGESFEKQAIVAFGKVAAFY
jgi:hypothetical protein